jgi:hypothetical protein
MAMTIKQATQKIAGRMDMGAVLSSQDLRASVIDHMIYNGQVIAPYHDTILRYLREMRLDGQRMFKCIDNHKSIYRRVL